MKPTAVLRVTVLTSIAVVAAATAHGRPLVLGRAIDSASPLLERAAQRLALPAAEAKIQPILGPDADHRRLEAAGGLPEGEDFGRPANAPYVSGAAWPAQLAIDPAPPVAADLPAAPSDDRVEALRHTLSAVWTFGCGLWNGWLQPKEPAR